MNEPLGMPKGTVRAVITILIIVAYLFFVGFSLYSKSFLGVTAEIPTYLTGLIGVTIGYYFGARAKEEKKIAAETGTTETPPQPIKFTPTAPTAPTESNEVNAA